MRTFAATFLVLFGLTGCTLNEDDPRIADVVVDAPNTREAFLEALAWWTQTSPDLRWTVSDTCREGRTCVTVTEEDLSQHGANGTSRVEVDAETGHRTVTVTLHNGGNDPTEYSFLVRVAAHEIGHALDLEHVEDYKDVMFATSAPFAQCLGTPSAAQYRELYGPDARWSSSCR